MSRPPNVIHEDSLPWDERAHAGTFGFRRKQLGGAAGGAKLGCSLYEIAPGRRAFPYHYHGANEEAIYVLAGSGTLRLPEGELPMKPGDYVALAAGQRGAHQVINTSDAVLRYLCFSTMIEPEVSVYPDSDKVGFFLGSAPGGSMEKRTLEGFVPLAARVSYWDKEG